MSNRFNKVEVATFEAMAEKLFRKYGVRHLTSTSLRSMLNEAIVEGFELGVKRGRKRPPEPDGDPDVSDGLDLSSDTQDLY